jgi:BASS family bile acid:Na+ symporter
MSLQSATSSSLTLTEQRRLVTSSALTHSPSFPMLRATAAWMHAWFVALLLLVDLLAALWPTGGHSLRSEIARVPGLDLRIDMPTLLLAGMLFNAGLALRTQHFFQVTQRPLLLILGTLSCWAIPLAVLYIVIKPLIWMFGVSDDVWLGLLMVAAMPAAQSSMAWTQNARGNVLLCLMLVLGTIVLCPVVIPWLLRQFSTTQVGERISWLHLLAWVIVPSVLGGIAGRIIGAAKLDHWRPVLSLSSAVMLLILNYINAADSLPGLFRAEGIDWTKMAMTLLLALILCGGSFGIAILWARSTRLPTPERTGLIYALGMKNNAIALTLSGGFFAPGSHVGLVLICYIVMQHLMAGLLSSHRQRQHALIEE